MRSISAPSVYDKNNLSGWAKDLINKVNTDLNFCLTPELMKELSGKEDTSELMAIIEMREDKLDNVILSENPFIVLFDRPSNKGNLGTMILFIIIFLLPNSHFSFCVASQ